MNTPTLTTERLILRRFTEGDLGALFRILRDGTVNEFLPWYPVKGMAEAKQFYEERYAAKYARPRAYAYAICLKGGGPIGYINVGTEEPYDLGYGLLQGFWHRGIVTEAARAVIEQVKKDGLPYITATHDRTTRGAAASCGMWAWNTAIRMKNSGSPRVFRCFPDVPAQF